ncbi:hypothetical protein ES703_60553 [subsurface metagenome]
MNNFAVLNIAYSHTATSIIISIGTNTPCHLTCYYTDKEPGSHRTSRNQRGLTLPWGVYYCFVAWQSVEQIEPGDTLVHTFEILDWSYCQTKWLAFRGTVAGELSPSVSPIFKYHHPGFYPTQTEYNQPRQIGVPDRPMAGQRLTIDNLKITTLSFVLSKHGSPEGNITFTIRRVSDDSIINSKIWGRAEALTTTPTWCKKQFDSPQTINEEGRLLVEVDSPFYDDFVQVWYQDTNVKPDENLTQQTWGVWQDIMAHDAAYITT